MKDNDIIKALECCIKDDCENCPYLVSGLFECGEHFNEDVLNLINRQKAEIERLDGCVKSEEEVRAIANATIQAGIRIIKAEAVKEFAERLKEKAWHGMWETTNHVDVDDIDNLVKEMVGEG